jgi:ferrous iron transport protein B
MGNPNVGKSVLFSKFTGMDVLASNYAGTTVSYTQGNMMDSTVRAVLIDVPGTYALDAASPAEEVAVDMLKNGSPHAILCVLDATNLERNLNFALQLKQFGLPTVYALNLMDVAQSQGISIDAKALSEALEAPVIPTVAIRNQGLKEILQALGRLIKDPPLQHRYEEISAEARWQQVGALVESVQQLEHRHPTLLERLGELSVKPFPGIPLAFVVLALTLALVVGGGKGLRAGLLLPLLNNVYVPFIVGLVGRILPEGILYNVLVGEYGVLIKGVEWPFMLILPYVFLFYLALSFLEDSGYLPRLGVLVDTFLKRLGIQGGNIIPIIMGYGCAVPAILGTRAAVSRKERIIVAAVVSLAVPCVAQTGAFIALLGDHSALVLVLVYLVSLLGIIGGGIVLNRMIPGQSGPMLMEIPNLLFPDRQSFFKKLMIRTKHFMVEAEMPMILAIAIAALIAETGLLRAAAVYIEPFITGWLGLPKEATLGLILGIIRRELAVLPLVELDLTTLQLFVGAVVALFYLPCLSVFAVLIKEFNIKTAALIALSTLVIAFLTGGVINHTVGLLRLWIG